MLPPGITESEFLEATETVVNVLCSRFAPFSYYSREDVAQQIRLMAVEAMSRYEPEVGPIGSFLFMHCKNRLLNVLRAFQGRRSEPACAVCHQARLGRGPGHPDGECRHYKKWVERNRLKQTLASPQDLTHVCDINEPRTRSASTVEDEAETNEILAAIDERLDVEDRRVLLQMRDGVVVPRKRRLEIQQRVLEILEEIGLSAEDIGLRETDDEQEGEVPNDSSPAAGSPATCEDEPRRGAGHLGSDADRAA